jgi:hypothetical protein
MTEMPDFRACTDPRAFIHVTGFVNKEIHFSPFVALSLSGSCTAAHSVA